MTDLNKARSLKKEAQAQIANNEAQRKEEYKRQIEEIKKDIETPEIEILGFKLPSFIAILFK